MLRIFQGILALGLLVGAAADAAAQDAFVGEVRYVGFSYCPDGWMEANGALLPIAQHEILYHLFGTTYGGDGTTTFALPDLRGRVPIGAGSGTGLTPRALGEVGGQETVTQLIAQLPAHTHALMATDAKGNTHKAVDNSLARVKTDDSDGSDPQVHVYSKGAPDTPMDQDSIGATGGSQPMNIMPPFVVLRPCICDVGEYPFRP